VTPGSSPAIVGDRPIPQAAPIAEQGAFSGTCTVCGNHYDKAFTIVHRGGMHVFDCFECAIHELAPSCARCSCRILGHGMESEGKIYCCSHCAASSGVTGLRDRV